MLIVVTLSLVVVAIGALIALPYAKRFADSSHSDALAIAMQQESEERARKCLVEIARRNPEDDADADIKRGDPTPLGQTESDHWWAEPRTRYVEACGNESTYEGELRQTGKWLKPTPRYGGTQIPRLPVPSEDSCERAVDAYIKRYNRRMSAREPGQVQKFCSRQRVSDFDKAAMGKL